MEKIGISAFLCSWSGDFTLTELGRSNPDPKTKIVCSGVKDTVYLSQWINIGSTQLLVMYDRGSSSNLTAGELAE